MTCISFAICTIRRSDVDDPSGPKETAWKESGFLAMKQMKKVSVSVQVSYLVVIVPAFKIRTDSYVPKRDSSATDCIHYIIAYATLSVGQENDYRHSVVFFVNGTQGKLISVFCYDRAARK